MDANEIKNGLRNFYGTESYTKYMGGILLTDGVKWLADNAKCYWLLDILWSIKNMPKVKREEFLTIDLKVKDQKAVFTAGDGNDNIVYKQTIGYTDFPLDEIRLFFCNNVLMLTSEY